MKKILPTVFSSILSLFLAIVLLAGMLCIYAKTTVCDADLLVTTANDCGYTTELYEEIKYKWENLLAITGVTDPDPIMQVLTPEQVQEDALAYLRDSYTGTATINTDELKAALEIKVRDYAYSNNIHATPQAELDQNIHDLVSACIQDYTTSIRIPMLPRILGSVSTIPEYLNIGIIICGIAAFMLLAFLFALQKKRVHTLYFVAISTATNALLLLGAVWLTEYNQLVERLPIDTSALRTLLCTYLHSLLDSLEHFGYQFLMATTIVLVLYLLIVGGSAVLRRTRQKSDPQENDLPSSPETE